jgi:hypothetical protein
MCPQCSSTCVYALRAAVAVRYYVASHACLPGARASAMHQCMHTTAQWLCCSVLTALTACTHTTDTVTVL